MKFKIRNDRPNDKDWWVWEVHESTSEESEAYVFDSESKADMHNLAPYLDEIASGGAKLKIVNS